MNRTEGVLISLYSDILAYASAKVSEYGLNDCDTLDIVSAAYLRAQLKVARQKCRRNRAELLKSIAWCETMDELKRRSTWQERMWQEAVRLDAPVEGDDPEGDEESLAAEGAFASDDGRYAAALGCLDEPCEEPVPSWIVDFRRRYELERRMPRKIIDALKKTPDHEKVRRRFSLSRGEFYKILKKVQMRFDPVFIGYHAWLAEKLTRECKSHLVNLTEGA